jgi:surfactin synthase thioesterase subunit
MQNRTLVIHGSGIQPQLRLICFPYAGASANIFQGWAEQLPAAVEVMAIEPAGRGRRFGEPAHATMDAMVTELLRYADTLTATPYVVFGHSLGCRVAFELAGRWKQLHRPAPLHFIGSGSRAPHVQSHKRKIAALPEAEFLSAIQELNGTPPEIVQNRELMQLLLPVLRADFTIAEEYQADSIVLDCPVTIFHGSRDPEVDQTVLSPWTELSRQQIRFCEFNGDHFFINSHKLQVLRQVRQILENILTEQQVAEDCVT